MRKRSVAVTVTLLFLLDNNTAFSLHEKKSIIYLLHNRLYVINGMELQT